MSVFGGGGGDGCFRGLTLSGLGPGCIYDRDMRFCGAVHVDAFEWGGWNELKQPFIAKHRGQLMVLVVDQLFYSPHFGYNCWW